MKGKKPVASNPNNGASAWVLLTSEEAAKLLRVSANTLSHWRTTGKGPPFVKYQHGKKPGRVCYRSVDLDRFIESCLQAST